MSEIKALSDRKQKKSTRILTFVLGGLLLAISIYIVSWYGILCGALLLAAGMFKKTTVANDEGITIIYNAMIYKYKEIWKFTEINELHVEKLYGREDTALHFMKEVMSKRVIFTNEDAKSVIEMAKSVNTSMHVDEAYYSK